MKKCTRGAFQLVRERDLHKSRNLPVDLSILYDEFQPVYDDLMPMHMLGHGMFPPSGVVSPAFPARIVIDQGLAEDDRRLVYGHEIGHYTCGQIHRATTMDITGQFPSVEERYAWTAAAIILIPSDVLLWAESPEEVASVTHTPLWLVELYCEIRASLN